MVRSSVFAVIIALGAIFTLLFPGDAFAWGPGAHMVMGNWILQNLSVLPPLVADPIMRYPGLFLHGCLSADIFIGKGSVAKKGHSHNWEGGQAVLAKARSNARRAYAYGYLAHLAADTVAHNVFVPFCMPIAPGNGKMAHVYLEMQADRLLDWDRRDALGVFRERGSKGALVMLRETFHKNPVQFGLQSSVFQGSIAVGGSVLWRRSLSVVDSIFPDHVKFDLLKNMLTVSTRAVLDVLRAGSASQVFSLDPVGTKALAHAVKKRSGKGFFPSRTTGSAPLPILPDVLQSLPAVYTAYREDPA